MTHIGFSTGCLYKTNLPEPACIKLYRSLGTTALELNSLRFGQWPKLNMAPELIDLITSFDYVSVHAPALGSFYYGKNEETRSILSEMQRLCGILPIRGVIIHPDRVEDFSVLESSQLPILIENMDVNKKIGCTPDYFKKLKKQFSFRFVLDVQHAWEHDHSMNLAKGLVGVMGSKLQHMHVSGSNELHSHHAQLSKADNMEAILRILRVHPAIPKIAEGIIDEPVHRNAEAEFSLLSELI